MNNYFSEREIYTKDQSKDLEIKQDYEHRVPMTENITMIRETDRPLTKTHNFKLPVFLVKKMEKEAAEMKISYDAYFLAFLTYVFLIKFTNIKKAVNKFISSRKKYKNDKHGR
ncbi:MAG: hypothetical protein AABX38_01390 [Candidatus Micrarchaeota archaeon]